MPSPKPNTSSLSANNKERGGKLATRSAAGVVVRTSPNLRCPSRVVASESEWGFSRLVVASRWLCRGPLGLSSRRGRVSRGTVRPLRADKTRAPRVLGGDVGVLFSSRWGPVCPGPARPLRADKARAPRVLGGDVGVLFLFWPCRPRLYT